MGALLARMEPTWLALSIAPGLAAAPPNMGSHQALSFDSNQIVDLYRDQIISITIFVFFCLPSAHNTKGIVRHATAAIFDLWRFGVDRRQCRRGFYQRAFRRASARR